MPFRNYTAFSIVASGATLPASPIDLRGVETASIVAPTSVGVNHFLQVSWSVTSANFGRLQLGSPDSGSWQVTSPPPNTRWGVELTRATEFPYAKIELATAATDTRTYTIVGKEGL